VSGFVRTPWFDHLMLRPFPLEGRHARLEPLDERHAEGLAAAAAEDRSSYAFTRVPDGVAAAEQYVRVALAEQATGRTLPFAVRRLSDDRVVGSTRYLDMEVFGTADGEPADDRPPSVLEIGATWYAASAQRTAVNTDVKLTLLTQAFDVWDALRVTLKTDARNQGSRTAILRLGARFEGVRRAHMPATDGTVRDTAYYSLLRAEWPEVRAALTGRLSAAGRPR
jgi:RimJ/RimL family protein N-acetyltransferase